MYSMQESQVVYISPALVSLGSINPKETKEASAKFRLHNQTNQPLLITKTITSCTCTGLSAPDVAIPRGGVADLTMKIESVRLVGHQRVTAQVWTDNPSFPHFELVATGDFAAGDSISPFYITLPALTPGQVIHHEFDIGGLEVKSVSQKLLFDALKVTFETTEIEGNPVSKLVFDGTVSLTKGKQEAKFSTAFKGVAAAVDVHVYANVIGRVHASPPALNFGIIERNAEVVRDVRLADRRSQGITKVILERGSGSVSLQGVQVTSAVAKLKLKFTASKREEFVAEQARLSVTFADGSVDDVSLPVEARIIAAR
jgi:hypothetical protein